VIITGKSFNDYTVTDICAKTNWTEDELYEEKNNLNFEEQIHTRDAEFEIYKTIVPAEPMRLIGKYSEYVGSEKVCIYISASENKYVCVWYQYTEQDETDEDLFAFTNYKTVNEFKTFIDYETFMSECKWSPENINTDNNIILDGPLYNSNLQLLIS